MRKKFSDALKVRVEIAMEKYKSGLISYQEWDKIENEFIDSERSLLDAEYNVFSSWAQWLKVTGKEE